MNQTDRKVVCSIISGSSFLVWAIGISTRNFFLTIIAGVFFISFLVLACASSSPPELSIPPPPPPEKKITQTVVEGASNSLSF